MEDCFVKSCKGFYSLSPRYFVKNDKTCYLFLNYGKKQAIQVWAQWQLLPLQCIIDEPMLELFYASNDVLL